MSWANQTRILCEQWKELLGILGSGLIQVLLPVVQFLNEVLKVLIEIAKAIGYVISIFKNGGLEESTDDISSSALDAAASEEALAEGITSAGKAAKSALAQFDELDVLQSNIASGGGGTDSGFNIPDIAFDAKEAKKKLKDLEDDFKNFIIDFNKMAPDFVIQPIVDPIFVDIPNPVYEPNWGLNPNPVLNPDFPALPSPVYRPQWGLEMPVILLPEFPLLPDPIYNPHWNINDSLVIETGYVYETISGFLSKLETVFKNVQLAYTRTILEIMSANKNLEVNFGTLRDTIVLSVTEWVMQSILSIQTWKQNVTTSAYDAVSNLIANINGALQTVYTNFSTWINNTSANLVIWGEGLSKIAADTANNLVTNILGGLKTIWGNFVELMKSIGESISEFWSENKNWLVPTLTVTGAVVVGGAIALSGGSLAAPLAAGGAALLPALATGAVIPPNQKFMAVLGDQKSGRNLEAPEGLIRQIMREELAGLQTGGTDVTITFDGNLAQLARVLNPVIKKEERRIGSTLRTGGVY